MSNLMEIFERVHQDTYNKAWYVCDLQAKRTNKVAETLSPYLKSLVQDLECETDFLVTNDKGMIFDDGIYQVELNLNNKINNKFVATVALRVFGDTPWVLSCNNAPSDLRHSSQRDDLARAIVTEAALQVAARERAPEIKVLVLSR